MHSIFSKSFCLLFLIFTLFACNEEAEKKTKKNSAPSSFDEKIVQIEEGTQRAAIDQLAKGDRDKSILEGELAANRYQNPQKADKIKRLLTDIDKIDQETGKFIQLVDEAKFHVMKLCGENIAIAKDKSKEHVVWNFNKKGPKNKFGCTPAKLNLYAIKAKDKKDIPTYELVGEEIFIPRPGGRGMKIWNTLIKYRSKICDIIGSFEIPGEVDSYGNTYGEKKYVCKTTKINKFKDLNDLDKQVWAMIKKQNINYEDKHIIKDLYTSLSKKEFSDNKAHWIGQTFNESSLATSLAQLSALQLEVLTARAKAIQHLKGRVSRGGFSFNKIVAFASGPGVAEANSPYSVQVVLGAYDSDNQPTATLDSVNGVALSYPTALRISNGAAVLERTAGSETETLSGTISIHSKSGEVTSKKWSCKVGIATSDK